MGGGGVEGALDWGQTPRGNCTAHRGHIVVIKKNAAAGERTLILKVVTQSRKHLRVARQQSRDIRLKSVCPVRGSSW